jgi:hypothetical protein
MMTKELANLAQVRLVLNKKGDNSLASPGSSRNASERIQEKKGA